MAAFPVKFGDVAIVFACYMQCRIGKAIRKTIVLQECKI